MNSNRFFAYILAEKLGYANVDVMLQEITWYQLNEWHAYFEIKDEIEKEKMKETEEERKKQEKKQKNLQAAKRGRW